MKLRILYSLFFLFFSVQSHASIFEQILLPKQLTQAQNKQYSEPYQCIERIDEYLQEQKDNVINETARLSTIRDSSLTFNDVVLIKQQKALCYFYAGHINQAIVLLDKLIEKSNSDVPVHFNQQTLLIKSYILSQSKNLLDIQLAQRTLDSLKENIQAHQYRPTTNSLFTTNYIRGEISLRLNDYDQSMLAYRQAEQYALKTPLSNNAAWATYGIGRTYEEQGKVNLAINAFTKSQELLLNDADILNGLLTKQLSHTYINQENYKLAISFANQSAQFYQNLGNKLELSISLLQLANMHRKINEYNLALVYYFNALDLLKLFNDRSQVNIVYFELGKTYLQMGNFTLAYQYLNSAVDLFRKNEQHTELLEALIYLSDLAQQQEDYENSLTQLQNALVFAVKLNDNKLLEKVYLYLAIGYEKTHQFEKALESYQQYIRYDRLSNFKNKRKEPTNDRDKENNEIKAQKIQQLESEITRLELTKQNLIVNTVLLLSLLLLAIYFYINSKKSTRQQQEDIAELEQDHDLHPTTRLNNIHSLRKYLPTPLQEVRYYADWEYSDKQKFIFSCTLIKLDFLQAIRDEHSFSTCLKVEKALGVYLKQQLQGSERLFQLNDDQLLFMKKVTRNTEPENIAAMLIKWFNQFDCPVESSNIVSIGMVHHPFLHKYPTAIDSDKLLNIGSLALSAASKLNKQHQRSHWIHLSALTYTQPAFFHGNIWTRTKQAIEKGLIKVNASADKNEINW